MNVKIIIFGEDKKRILHGWFGTKYCFIFWINAENTFLSPKKSILKIFFDFFQISPLVYEGGPQRLGRQSNKFLEGKLIQNIILYF